MTRYHQTTHPPPQTPDGQLNNIQYSSPLCDVLEWHNCASTRDITAEDVSSIRYLLNRMVEFAAYQAATDMNPGVTEALERYQVMMAAIINLFISL